MAMALDLARQAALRGEVPVGAVIVKDGQLIASGANAREEFQDALRHAEIDAIGAACKQLGAWRLSGCTLYVTLEPCLMCAGAVHQARIDRVVFGAFDPKAGAMGSLYQVHADVRLNHRLPVTAGVLATECGEVLKAFFRARRQDSPK
ncbi:MAG: tRNA adenosine(34) deaminase TadA [Proteobacteria bacterium]|nr:tRNA adenosine(34) deaminase TadA [Pseudomonadota bacterium]